MKEQNKEKIYHNFYSHLTKTFNFFFLKWTTVHDLATCLSSGSAGHWPGHNRTSLSILWDKLHPMTRGQLCSRPGPGLLQKAGLWPQRQNGHLLHRMRRKPNSKRVCPMDCLKLHIYCSTAFEISTFLLQVLCGHRYQTSQLPKCQSVHWGASEEADSLTLPSPY